MSKEQKPQRKAAATTAPPTSADVTWRGSWDRLQYKRATMVSLSALGVAFGALILCGILFVSRPEPRYFSVTNDFRVVELQALSEPMVTDPGMLNWCSDVVVRTFSMDFLHFRQQLGDVRKFYAPDAFEGLVSSLKTSGILDLVKQKRLSVRVTLGRTPIITARGMVSGAMSWKVEVPVVSSYESSQGVENTQQLMATLLVQRADPRVYPDGIYVKQIVLK